MITLTCEPTGVCDCEVDALSGLPGYSYNPTLICCCVVDVDVLESHRNISVFHTRVFQLHSTFETVMLVAFVGPVVSVEEDVSV